MLLTNIYSNNTFLNDDRIVKYFFIVGIIGNNITT